MLKSSFEVLGVPKMLVEHARSTGDFGPLRKLAEDLYRGYAKQYHPDRNSDAVTSDFFVEVTDAIEDLRDPVGFEVAVDYYVGDDAGVDMLATRRASAKQADLKKGSFKAITQLMPLVDQYALLGITSPTNFFLNKDDTSRSALKVSPEGKSFLSGIVSFSGYDPKFDPKSGVWSESYEDIDDSESAKSRKRVYDVDHWQRVAAIGFIPKQSRSDDTADFLSADTLLESPNKEQAQVYKWTEPEHSWFLPQLTTTPKHDTDLLIVANPRGLVTIAGSILAQATTK